eukprot:scaffold4470_cov255-Prasinococcus_capsulatus_cf.AAC.23
MSSVKPRGRAHKAVGARLRSEATHWVWICATIALSFGTARSSGAAATEAAALPPYLQSVDAYHDELGHSGTCVGAPVPRECRGRAGKA